MLRLVFCPCPVHSVALVGVCGGAGAYISIRAIGRRATATHSIAYFALYSCLVSLFLMWVRGEPFVVPRGALWVSLLALVGIFGFIAQVSTTKGSGTWRARHFRTRSDENRVLLSPSS